MSNEQTRILLIDDEKNYLLVLEALLLDAGYTVTALNDPETALAFLDESEVDVVITDMKMPKLSGKEVLQHIKRDYPHICRCLARIAAQATSASRAFPQANSPNPRTSALPRACRLPRYMRDSFAS